MKPQILIPALVLALTIPSLTQAQYSYPSPYPSPYSSQPAPQYPQPGVAAVQAQNRDTQPAQVAQWLVAISAVGGLYSVSQTFEEADSIDSGTFSVEGLHVTGHFALTPQVSMGASFSVFHPGGWYDEEYSLSYSLRVGRQHGSSLWYGLNLDAGLLFVTGLGQDVTGYGMQLCPTFELDIFPFTNDRVRAGFTVRAGFQYNVVGAEQIDTFWTFRPVILLGAIFGQ